jgi:FKBP-type peptidyl-prolyl cis-trans isomerase FklB
MGQCIMRRTFTFTAHLIAAVLFIGHALAQQPTTTPAAKPASPAAASQEPALKARPELPTEKDKFSYALGMNFGTTLRKQGVPFDPDVFVKALKTSFAGGQTLMTDDEARAAIMEVQNQLRKQQQEKAQVEGEANKKAGEAFLAANKSKDGVVTLPDGLQYKILVPGTGPKPTPTDSVTVNYRGTLVNGSEFDSSYKRGQPATFPVNGVIKGWTEALQLMPVGSKWQLFIPSDLAYGERAPGEIGPNSTLIFEVELLKIGADKQPAPAKQ